MTPCQFGNLRVIVADPGIGINHIVTLVCQDSRITKELYWSYPGFTTASPLLLRSHYSTIQCQYSSVMAMIILNSSKHPMPLTNLSGSPRFVKVSLRLLTDQWSLWIALSHNAFFFICVLKRSLRQFSNPC